MADPCLEEVVLYAVLHELVLDGLLGDFFKVFDGFVVVACDGGCFGDLEPEFIGEAI